MADNSRIDSGADITGDAVADTGLQTVGRDRRRRRSGPLPVTPGALYPSTVTFPGPTSYPGA